MSTQVDRATLEAELTEITGLTLSDFEDLERLSPEDRELLVEGWRALGKLSWTQTPSAWDRTLAILNLLGTIAADVSGVAGAFSAVAALRAL